MKISHESPMYQENTAGQHQPSIKKLISMEKLSSLSTDFPIYSASLLGFENKHIAF
jgi:hypothetical protein